MSRPGPDSVPLVWLVNGEPRARAALKDRLGDTLGRRRLAVFPCLNAALDELGGGPPPAALLVDVRSIGAEATIGLARLCAAAPHTPALLLSPDPEAALRPALHAGAWGCLHRDSPPAAIAAAVRATLGGAVLVPPPTARDLLDVPPVGSGAAYRLTARERDVLGRLVMGRSQREVAADLFLSTATVNTHVQRIYTKLGVRSATGAVAKAVREGLV